MVGFMSNQRPTRPKQVQDAHFDLERCPHCGVHSPDLVSIHRVDRKDNTTHRVKCWNVYACSRCGALVCVYAFDQANQPPVDHFPKAAQVDDGIPGNARELLKQAIDALPAPAASVMASASSVDWMLKEKGYPDGSLYQRIDKAKDDGVITADMAQWAHDVRLDANDQRHADPSASLPSTADAQRCIDFVQALGQLLFVLPARVKRGLGRTP